MQKLIDEFDHLIAPGTIVTNIILSGATYDDWGYTLQENDNADFFTVDVRKADGTTQAIGDFSEREDALAYAARMVEKYQALLTDNTRKLLND